MSDDFASYCPHCHTGDPGEDYCASCGERLEDDESGGERFGFGSCATGRCDEPCGQHGGCARGRR